MRERYWNKWYIGILLANLLMIAAMIAFQNWYS